MRDSSRRLCLRVAALLVPLATASTAWAQQLNTSAAALGVGGNFTARARGYEAVAWNPANLGLSGNPGFSLTLLPVAATFTLDPITLADIKDAESYKVPNVVPRATRQAWLDKVTAAGGEKVCHTRYVPKYSVCGLLGSRARGGINATRSF